MLTWFGNLKVWIKLAITLWLILVVAWTSMIFQESRATRAAAIQQAKQFSLSMHETTMAGLTGMMITGTIGQRDVFLDQIRELSAIKDLKVLRGEETAKVFGPGTAAESVVDDVERQVLASGKAVVEVRQDKDGGEYLLAVRPTLASKNYLGKDCVLCHQTPEGTVLGAVGMKISLDEVNDAVRARLIQSIIFAIGASLVIMVTIYWVLSRLLAQPLNRVIEHLDAIADGDLMRKISQLRRDEIGHVRISLAKMQENLTRIMREIEDSGRSMVQTSYQVAEISNEISHTIRAQEAKSKEVGDAMRTLHETALRVRAQADDAVVRSEKVDALAREGIDNVRRNIAAMEETVGQVERASAETLELNHGTRQIEAIVGTIREIAEQTNLLALNAAIEAARAGEQGRGFAVVADEVRKLAERTTHSAAEVSRIIAELTGKVRQAAATIDAAVGSVGRTQEVARSTAGVIETMANNVSETALANRDISAAARNQMEQFELLSQTLDNLFVILGENSTKVESTALVGEDMRKLAQRLNDIMAGFDFPRLAAVPPAQHEQRRAPRSAHALRVDVRQDNNRFVAVGSDFSLVGLRLRLVRAGLDPQRPLELIIHLPEEDIDRFVNQEPIRCQGRIVWQREVDGHPTLGIEFINQTEQQREALVKCYEFYRENYNFSKAQT